MKHHELFNMQKDKAYYAHASFDLSARVSAPIRYKVFVPLGRVISFANTIATLTLSQALEYVANPRTRTR